jgi:hypothetical protein
MKYLSKKGGVHIFKWPLCGQQKNYSKFKLQIAGETKEQLQNYF